MKRIMLLLIILFVAGASMAQRVYYTKSALLDLHGELEGQALNLNTRELSITLEYETAKIIIRVPLRSLDSGVDSLNRIIEKSSLELVFTGQLSLGYINTENHPPLKFSVEGFLAIDDFITQIRGDGELHHVDDDGAVACMLGMRLHLNLENMNIDPPFPNLENEFEVVITQAVLKKVE